MSIALSPQALTWLDYPDHYKVLDVPANVHKEASGELTVRRPKSGMPIKLQSRTLPKMFHTKQQGSLVSAAMSC